MMSPKEVRARTWTVSADGSGSSAGVRWLWRRPNLVVASIQAAVPSLIPISSAPEAVSMVTVPRATWPRRMLPLAVLAVTSRPASSIVTSPLADLTFTSPLDPADPRLAVEVLDVGVAGDGADGHVAGRDDLGLAGCLLDRDVSGAGAHPERPGPIEPDVAGAGLDLDVAETAVACGSRRRRCRRAATTVRAAPRSRRRSRAASTR